MTIRVRLISVAIGLLLAHSMTAQVMYNDRYNKIVNDSTLISFYDKLNHLQNGDSSIVNIVQIGDSHIQADFLSGSLRTSFQQMFGDAGRGLVFPYAVAGTNGPYDYNVHGTGGWIGRRNVLPYPQIPTGVMGFGLQTKTPGATLSFSLPNTTAREVTLFTTDSGRYMPLYVLYGENNTPAKLVSKDTDVWSFKSDTAINRFTLLYTRAANTQTEADFYGASILNGHKGVVYHSIGVNGAAFSHYNQTPAFFTHLTYLHPDLIIISLGTNDTYARDYNDADFSAQVSNFFAQLRKAIPHVCIIITTPGDHMLQRRWSNPRVPKAGSVLKQYALENNMAYWDFYNVMGGTGSFKKLLWRGMGQHDGIHFTRAGYVWQANLFFDAINTSYKNFTPHK